MITSLYSRESWAYKSVFDGLDFSKSKVGHEFLNVLMLDYINNHCILHDDLDLENFVVQCCAERRRAEPHHKIPVNLRDKYEIGVFTTSKQNCADCNYILFNQEQLEFWDGDGLSTWGLEFLVCPSRDREGRINEIGFRILDTKRVLDAFKWLFMMGGRATYGLNKVRMSPNTKVIAVEGCFDQLAFEESGTPNVIGLGSVFVNPGHEDYLKHLDITFCLDQDRFGISQRQEHQNYCFFTPDAKDPFDAWVNTSCVKPVFVDFSGSDTLGNHHENPCKH